MNQKKRKEKNEPRCRKERMVKEKKTEEDQIEVIRGVRSVRGKGCGFEKTKED